MKSKTITPFDPKVSEIKIAAYRDLLIQLLSRDVFPYIDVFLLGNILFEFRQLLELSKSEVQFDANVVKIGQMENGKWQVRRDYYVYGKSLINFSNQLSLL